MSPNIKIAPSILAADFSRLGDQIREAEAAGADLIHVDVMDGHFVPNITLGPVVVKSIRRVTELPLDVHLMIDEPERFIAPFADAGADALTVHGEATPHIHRALQQIHSHGLRAGVSLNPGTPINTISEIIPYLDLVLVMSVNPGFGGQAFIEHSLGKIDALRALLDSLGSNADIVVDGGVGPDNAGEIIGAGANVLVAGSAIFGSDDISAAIRGLREAARRRHPS